MRVSVSMVWLAFAGCLGGNDKSPSTAEPTPNHTDEVSTGDTAPAGDNTDEDTPIYSGEWTLPSRADVEGLDLPPNPHGNGYLVLETAEISLVADPELRSPITAASGCLSLMVACYAPGERNLPGCFDNVPQCGTTEPWTEDELCCAAACTDRYAALRAAGHAPPLAAAGAIFDSDSCMPGLDAWRSE